MNQADYLRNPWWEMFDQYQKEQAERRRVWVREQREVRNEIIKQDVAAGKHYTRVAEEHGLHPNTVQDILRGVYDK